MNENSQADEQEVAKAVEGLSAAKDGLLEKGSTAALAARWKR